MTTKRKPLEQVQLSAMAFTVGHWLPRAAMGSRTGEPERDPFDMKAPYQRGSVWSDVQRVALIKSLYMGIPVGAIITSILPVTDKYHVRVIDGKQRIETVRMWIANTFQVPSWWFGPDDYEGDAEFVHFGDLTVRSHRRFENSQLPCLEFNGQTVWLGRNAKGVWSTRQRSPQELLMAEAELYGLINGGGTPQTAADMARAAAIASRPGRS